MEKKSEQPALEQLGLSRNARKLLRGLEARGVKLDPSGVAYHIGQNPGQGMMNKAAGEIGPTWYLLAGPGTQHGKVIQPGSTPTARYGSESFLGVESYIPLGWIVRHPPQEWGLNRSDNGLSLVVEVNDNPPHWTC